MIQRSSGREREALDRIEGRQGRMDFDEIKLVAKYAVGREASGVGIGAPRPGEARRHLLTAGIHLRKVVTMCRAQTSSARGQKEG